MIMSITKSKTHKANIDVNIWCKVTSSGQSKIDLHNATCIAGDDAKTNKRNDHGNIETCITKISNSEYLIVLKQDNDLET